MRLVIFSSTKESSQTRTRNIQMLDSYGEKMSTFEEIGDIPKKYQKHKEALILNFKEYEIDSIKSLISKYRTSLPFKKNWSNFWSDVAKQEGGKLSLTTVGLLIGASFGGVGIAAMGSAIGMPLALVLGLGGLLSGSKFDSLLVFSSDRKVATKISKECYKAIESKANDFDFSVSEYVKLVLESEAAK